MNIPLRLCFLILASLSIALGATAAGSAHATTLDDTARLIGDTARPTGDTVRPTGDTVRPTGDTARPNDDREPAPLPAEIARLARELESVPPSRDGDFADMEQEPGVADPTAPANALRTALADLRLLMRGSDPRSARALDAALGELQMAWDHFSNGSDDLSHLSESLHALQRTQNHLRQASRGSARPSAPVGALQADLSAAAMRISGDLLGAVEEAGVRPSRLAAAKRQFELGLAAARRGDHGPAAAHHAASSKIAANTVVFDVELFRQLVLDTIEDETVGHALSISFKGLLYDGGDGVGLARTSADAPETDQAPTKESHVASVSKTITAIALLRLLDDLGLSPDEPVAPYLPSNWMLGDGVDELTFADFMKHESGFAQNSVGSSYDGLRTGIATDVGATSYLYNNGNYGLMRVLIPGLLGIDPVDYEEFSSPELMAAAFIIYVRSLYNPLSIEIDCKSNDANPTIQYKFPYPGDSGYLEPNRWDACGGVGWFIDSNEIASTMTHLRNTTALLPTDVRSTMQQDFLGFMDPANWGGSIGGAINGSFGINYMHGGDWGHSGDELHACTIAFPIKLEAGIIINSELGAAPYQCVVLADAFEGAWVEN